MDSIKERLERGDKHLWQTLNNKSQELSVVDCISTTPTKMSQELVNIMACMMIHRGRRLTHLFVSPKSMQDLKEWDEPEIDSVTKNCIFEEAHKSSSKFLFSVVECENLDNIPGPKERIYGVDLSDDDVANSFDDIDQDKIIVGVIDRSEWGSTPCEEKKDV